MNHERRQEAQVGLRPRVSAACRTWLRDLDGRGAIQSPHCDRCASMAAFLHRFAPLLAIPPRPPAALASQTTVERIQERIVDGATSGSGGELLARAPVPVFAAEWSDGLLLSPVTRAAMGEALIPTPPDLREQLRHSILADLGARRVRRASRGFLLGLVAAAIVMVTAGLLLAGGETEQPLIVFSDLQTLPGGEYTALRYGALR